METSLHHFFNQLPDPRIHRNKKHLLIDIIVLSIIAVICGAESWNSIEMFGNSKKDFLSRILKLPNGIPSHDTINRVFSLLRPEKFEQLFAQWVQSLRDKGISGEVIAIDGKTMRGSKDSYHDKLPIHIVSAWANSNQLVLGQVKTNEKSNEITAIPELLNILDIEGCIISIDAMGTQKKIAETIIDKQADYILALKANQGYLAEGVQNTFIRQQSDSTDETVEKGHGRLETRKCEVINKLDFLDEKEQWVGLKSIVRVTATREINDKKSSEIRLYISSVVADAKSFNSFIRQHWGVENSLHWTLDVTFREDAQRKRNGHAANNFALVEKIALNLLKMEQSKNMSIKSKRLVAAWDNKFLLKVLNI
ncbi:MAG: ISAs1 family transposase [Bacteroidales bacterium]|nr:ISAs1 family transposase [Bacteroidales bacterium]